MAALYIGLDLGTQGVKAFVYDHEAKAIVGRGFAAYDLLPTSVPGRAEQDPAAWIEGVKAAMGAALAGVDASRVKAIGVSGQQHGLVAMDAAGRVLRPAKLWCDTESAPEARELSEKFGFPIVPSFTATKVLWLQRHEPDAYAAMAHILLPGSYLNFWLTGRHAMEAGDASGTGLFSARARAWDAAAMAVIDPALASRLPALIGPNEVVGEVRAEVAAELGLPAGVVVAPGSGDNAISALGSGVVKGGQCMVSLGTSGTLFGKSDVPIVDISGAVAPFCDATGAWLPLVCTLNCTRPAEEVREAFGLDRAAVTAAAEAEPPGCEGLTMLPYLAGERTPNWPGASGALLGLRAGMLARPGLLYRAALEGATFSLYSGLQRMVELGMTPNEVRLVGGGSKNKLWQQIVADVFQLPVRLPLESESSALGAALQAGAVHTGTPVADYVTQHMPAMAEGVVQPDPARREAYAAAFALFQAQGAALFAGPHA